MKQLGVNIRLASNSTNEFLQESIVKALPFANRQMIIYKNDLDPRQNITQAQLLPKKLGIKYKADSWLNQNIKLPSALINQKSGDCKSFALLVAGYLQANNIVNGLIFVGYNNAKQPSHVYNFAIFEGSQYFIDSTISAAKIPANKEKETLIIEVMNTNLIASAFEDEINGKKRRERRAPKKAARKEKREQRRAEGKGVFQRVKKVALAPARGAFLALIALNVHSLATKLKKGIAKNPQTVKRFWERVGGKFDKLQKSVNTGATKKAILGVDANNSGVGSVAALLASAAPIVLAAAKLLSDLKVENGEGGDLMDLVPEGTEPLGEDFTVTDKDEQGSQKSARGSGDKDPKDSGGFELSSPLVLGGLGLLAALMFTNSN